MRRLAIALVTLGVAFLPSTAAVHANAVDLGYEFTTDADPEGPDLVTDFMTETIVNDLGVGMMASRCTPASNRSKHATITYYDNAGLPTYAFHHDITFSYNCKVVTKITHRPWYEIFQPQYSFNGYLVNAVSPAGQKKATAKAQARFGICTDVVGDVCALERDPSIVWNVDFTGKAYAKSTP